jgi:hypothetical protein
MGNSNDVQSRRYPTLAKSQGLHSQSGGTCYAHATAHAIHAAEQRIFGRRPEDELRIVRRLAGRHGGEGYSAKKCLDEECPAKTLRNRYVSAAEAIKAVEAGRVALMTFSLTENGWGVLSSFFHQNPYGVLTMKELKAMAREFSQVKQDAAIHFAWTWLLGPLAMVGNGIAVACATVDTSSHAVAVVGVENVGGFPTWVIQNSWGNLQQFRVRVDDEIHSLVSMNFVDVFFIESDLSSEERAAFYRRTR